MAIEAGELQKAYRRVSYYVRGIARDVIPYAAYEAQLRHLWAHLDLDAVPADIRQAVNYYNRLSGVRAYPLSGRISKMPLKNSRYYYDLRQYLKYFGPRMALEYIYGDVAYIPELPSIVKSRPIEGDTANSVILNLDKFRHFRLIPDRMRFRDKEPKAVWRGAPNNPLRLTMMERHGANPRCDIGHVGGPHGHFVPKPFISPANQLRFRYILSVEGYDVATNLKWIMASRSLCLMPRPRFETWFMEGRLVPGVHYVELKDDFSDLDEKMAHYDANPDEAEGIIAAANDYMRPFLDPRRERLVSLLVLQKYFEATGQLGPSRVSPLFA